MRRNKEQQEVKNNYISNLFWLRQNKKRLIKIAIEVQVVDPQIHVLAELLRKLEMQVKLKYANDKKRLKVLQKHKEKLKKVEKIFDQPNLEHLATITYPGSYET